MLVELTSSFIERNFIFSSFTVAHTEPNEVGLIFGEIFGWQGITLCPWSVFDKLSLTKQRVENFQLVEEPFNLTLSETLPLLVMLLALRVD